MSKAYKFCCPALEMACNRANENQRVGIQTGSMFTPKGARMTVRTAVVIYFPKAKKGDESKYGFKSEWKNTTYGLCKFCPFCGTRLEVEAKADEEAPAGKSDGNATPRSGRKRHGCVVGAGAKPGSVQPAE